MRTRLATLVIAVLGTTAYADNAATIYTAKGMLLVQLEDDGKLAALVGNGHKGVVQCFTADDKVEATMGAGEIEVTGCFVGIRRNGKLAAPPSAKTRWDLPHLAPEMEAGITVEAGKAKDTLQLMIGGMGANAIGLWIDCTDKRGDVRCQEDNGMAGKYSWDIVFTVGKGGAIRPTPPLNL